MKGLFSEAPSELLLPSLSVTSSSGMQLTSSSSSMQPYPVKTNEANSVPRPFLDERLKSKRAPNVPPPPNKAPNVPPPLSPKIRSRTGSSSSLGSAGSSSPRSIHSPKLLRNSTLRRQRSTNKMKNTKPPPSPPRRRTKSLSFTDEQTPPKSVTRKTPGDRLKELEQSLQRHIVKHGEKSPKVAMDYLQIGNEHFRKGHMMEAEANYMLAVQCDPSEHLSKAYLNLGTVKWRTGDLPSAIHFLQRALGPDELGTELRGISLEESTTAASAYHQLGICYALCGEWQRAISSLEAARMIRVRVLGPADVSVGRTLDMIGKVWSMQGNYEEAMNYYQKALVCLMSTDNVSNVSDANIATVLLNMARVQMTAGHPGAALTALQRAYKLLKTDMVAGRNCGEFQDPMKASLYQQTLQMLDRLRDLDTTCQAMKCLEEEAG